MNWDRIEGNWQQLKGNIKQQWGKLSEDQLDVIAGKHERLSVKIQEIYSITKDETENFSVMTFSSFLGIIRLRVAITVPPFPYAFHWTNLSAAGMSRDLTVHSPAIYMEPIDRLGPDGADQEDPQRIDLSWLPDRRRPARGRRSGWRKNDAPPSGPVH